MLQNEKYCIIIRSTLNTNKRIEKVKILQVLPENDCYVELKVSHAAQQLSNN